MSIPHGLQTLQHDAYTAVCRAFYAQESLPWDQEDVLTKLRDIWNISNQMHSSITSEMRSDPDVVAVRSGGMPASMGRGKTGLMPAPSLGLAPQPSVRRAAAPTGFGSAGSLQRMGSGMQRSRSTRQNGYGGGSADPLGYVGRRLWRFWPLENPPWVEGFIQQWDPDADSYVIVYDPNTRESTEEVFHFGSAVEGGDYVVGEYVDMMQVHGSRRQLEKPYISPEALQAAPPPGMLAALAPPPSKKRKSVSGAPVPADAPFEPTYLIARLPVAAEDELYQMLAVLERKERVVEAEINILEYQEANREDIEKRTALERQFQELCDREEVLMRELAAHLTAPAAHGGGAVTAMGGLAHRSGPLRAPGFGTTALRSRHGVCRPLRRLQCRVMAVENPFRYPREMSGLQSALAGLPTAGVYLVGAALAAWLGGGGAFAAQSLAPEGTRQAAKLAAAAAGVAVGTFLTFKLKATRQSAAIIELANLLVSLGDPTALTREQVAAIESKYGTSLAASYPEELKGMYGAFVEAVVPTGDAPVTGVEPGLIQGFKAALGLSDVDAAPAHIEVGRRFLRGRMEAGNREEDAEARKNFQKLIYISNLVFGDRQAAFLLPWARVFGLSEAQLYVAKRDNAKGIFKQYLDSQGGQLQADKSFLSGLKSAQAAAKLADDEASALVKEAARSKVEALFDAALECIKQRSRTRDYSEALDAMSAAVAFNRSLAALAGDADIVAGVGPTSVLGGAWEQADGRSRDLRDMFKVYLDERLNRDGAFTDSLEADAAELKLLMGLGNKEAAEIEATVKQAAYQRLLREEVKSGRLAAATSKAQVLGELVEKLRFDADAARTYHETLYRQKLSSLLEKKRLTDEDDAALREMQVQLCIQNEERDKVHAEQCGALFKDAVNDALAAGIDGFSFQDRQRVQAAFRDLRMDRPAARQVLKDAARKHFLQFITQSRNTRNRLDASKELKKLVFFSNIVVTPLLEDLKTEEEKQAEAAAAKQQKEMMELMRKAQEDAAKKQAEGAEAAAAPAAAKEGEEAPKAEADAEASSSDIAAAEAEVKELLAEATAAADKEDDEAAKAAKAAAEEAAAAAASSGEAGKVKSLAKAESAAAERATGEVVGDGSAMMKSQKDITVAEDLDLRDRTDIYKNFLLYCMTGDVVQGPMGVTMVTERDDGEFARLSQLGDILGLSQMDVGQVHQGMAEQAFKQQVQSVLGDGNLTPDRAAALEKMRAQMGLGQDAADKIIRGFTNQKAIAGMQALKAQGRLSMEKVLEIREAGVDVGSVLGEDARAQLYRTEVVTRLSDGTGNFDAERMLQQLPADLGIDAGKAAATVEELAKARKQTTLVQAISYLRQKQVSEAAKALNNLVSCEAAVPSEGPVSWRSTEELSDLYSCYVSKESAPEKQAVVQRILGLGDSDADNLRSIVDSGGFKLVPTFRRIAVFCGASSGSSPMYVDAAAALGAEMAARGIGLVYGGGNVGLMGSVAEAVGSRLGPEHVLGVIPAALAPREISGTTVGEIRVVDSMHERKALMFEEADAFISIPGGFGTLDETLEVTTWQQLGFHSKPVGLLNIGGFYDKFLEFLDHATQEGFIRPTSRSILISAGSPSELIDKLAAYRPPPSLIQLAAAGKLSVHERG
ncbi:hypothetical protein ACK3TF_000429 [Chlorella vulgaris]